MELVVLNYRVKLAEEHVKIAQQNIASAQEKIKFGLETPLYLEEAKAEALNREISYADIQIALRRKVSHFMSLSGSADPLNLKSQIYFGISVQISYLKPIFLFWLGQ